MSATIPNADLRHKRMGYPNDTVLETIRQSEGLGAEYRDTPLSCATCKINKNTQAANPEVTNHRETEQLEMVHTDIINPIKPKSIGRF